MNNKIVFDMFSDSKSTAMQKICSYFDLPLAMVEKSLDYGCSTESFIDEFKINLNEYDSKNIAFVGRHITTANEKTIGSFKQKGLLDLRSSLQMETPLSEFLKKFKLQVDVDNRLFKYRDKIIPIEGRKDCEHICFMGKDTTCRWSFGCEPFQKLSILHNKLYNLEATLEFFVAGTVEEMLDYSTVSRCPEILDTIDQLISSIYRPYSQCYFPLCYKWVEEHAQCYMIEFCVSLNNMETYNPISYEAAFCEIENCFKWSNITYDDYCKHNIPKKVYDNKYLIDKIIDVYVYNYNEQYGSLLPGLYVSPDELKIYEVSGKELIHV